MEHIHGAQKRAHPHLPCRSLLPITTRGLRVPFEHVSRIEVNEPRVDAACSSERERCKRVLTREVAELRRGAHDVAKRREVRSNMLRSDERFYILAKHSVIRPRQVVMHAGRI